MKKHILSLLAFCLLTALLAGCADPADTLRREGDYPGAIAEYSKTLAAAQNPREIAGTRFMRGVCYQENGQYSEAYVDLYVATAMACWLDVNEQSISPNRAMVGSLAMNQACDESGPERLRQLEASLSAPELDKARDTAQGMLEAKYKQYEFKE